MIVRLTIGAFAVFWCVMAIAPHSRSDWLLENCDDVARRRPADRFLARAMVVAVFAADGARVPRAAHDRRALHLFARALRRLGATLFGHTINSVTGWQRNEFDRLVHFAFGVLLANGCHDALVRSGHATSRAAWWVTLLIAMSASHVYELIEWGAAEHGRR